MALGGGKKDFVERHFRGLEKILPRYDTVRCSLPDEISQKKHNFLPVNKQ